MFQVGTQPLMGTSWAEGRINGFTDFGDRTNGSQPGKGREDPSFFSIFWSKIQCLESLKGEPRVTRVDSPFRFVYARIDRPTGTIKFGPLAEQSMGDWRQLCLFGGWLTYQCLVALDEYLSISMHFAVQLSLICVIITHLGGPVPSPPSN